MSAFLAIGATIALAAVMLRLSGLRGAMLKAALAALMLGGAGYALQGSPGTPGFPAPGTSRQPIVPLVDARHAFFGSFASGESWLRISEALAQSGNRTDAVKILNNAVKRHPGDAQLWVGLGNALVDQAGTLTPPAEFAYRQASAVMPQSPAGAFFHGLALARSGDTGRALAMWREILAAAPADASWRPLIQRGVEALSEPASSE